MNTSEDFSNVLNSSEGFSDLQNTSKRAGGVGRGKKYDGAEIPDHNIGHDFLIMEEAYTLWLLLDSRVVDVLMAYNPTFARLSSVKPLFFNNLKNELRFSGNAGA